MIYRIVVRGELAERYAAAFGGMKIGAKSDQTTITGEVVDQAHLHGVLYHINSIGLELLSVESGTARARDLDP